MAPRAPRLVALTPLLLVALLVIACGGRAAFAAEDDASDPGQPSQEEVPLTSPPVDDSAADSQPAHDDVQYGGAVQA